MRVCKVTLPSIQTTVTRSPVSLQTESLLPIPEDPHRQEGSGKRTEPPLAHTVPLCELEKDALPGGFPLWNSFLNSKTFYRHLLET